MINKDKVYQIKIDNPQHLYNLTISDEEVDINIINGIVNIREGIYNDIVLRRLSPLSLVAGNDYQIIAKDSSVFQKTTIITTPTLNETRDGVMFQGKVLGQLRLSSKGIVQFFIPINSDDMLIYNLEQLGRHENE